MSLGAKVKHRVLNRLFGWEYISVVHDGQIKTYRVNKSPDNSGRPFAYIEGRRYSVHDDGWLRQWADGENWKRFEAIT